MKLWSFERTYTYLVPVSEEHAKAFGLPPKEFEATITIEATEKQHDQTRFGQINIFLPGYHKETKDLAYSLAGSLAEHVSFGQHRIRIDGSFISSELLPETLEEEAAVGENRFSWTMRLKEVQGPIPFDSASLQRVTNNPLVRQYNAANDAESSIDCFIGLFKILEDLFGGRPLKASFKRSPELWRIANEHLKVEECGTSRTISHADFEKLVDLLVDTRHECAHLRRSIGFGITYGDSRVRDDVEPLLVPLRTLAREAIQISLESAAT